MMKTPRWFVDEVACAGYDAEWQKNLSIDRGKSGKGEI